MRKALMVDTQYCTGCHSCEIACRNEKELPLGVYGIKLGEVGPFEVSEDYFIWDYTPMVTELCDLCEDRVAAGEAPACVHNCLADAIELGTLDELAAKMDAKGSKAYLMIP